VCATVAPNKKHNKSQCSTNNERVSVAGKDGEDEKEGTNVFSDVGDHGSTTSMR
jgi:hypothetical protein